MFQINYELLQQSDDGQWDVIANGGLEMIAAMRRDNQASNPGAHFHIRPTRN